MATVDDFVGRNCPYCHAVDSLETDEARGEVACRECAKVVAMGLEESLNTRYNENATYDDVDHHALHEENTGVVGVESGVSRSRAAALAAGVVKGSDVAHGVAARRQRFARTPLHPRMRQYLENLCRMTRRGESVQQRALSLAQYYVGHRRERRERVEQQNEIAAVCVMLASELAGLPLPLTELHVLDPSLKRVQELRAHVVTYTDMQDEEYDLQRVFAPNLLRYYIRLLQLQMNRYEQPCTVLLRILRQLGKDDHEWSRLVDAERVAVAVLLARSCPSLQWKTKPLYDAGADLSGTSLYTSFAASAHLNESRVQKIMQLAQRSLPGIVKEFDRQMHELSAKADATTANLDCAEHATARPASTHVAGVKRERSVL